MYKGFSRPRRFWRIIYPTLLILAISVMVVICYGVAICIIAAINGETSFEVILDYMNSQVINNAMWVQLVTGILSLIVFIPLWLKTRKLYKRYSGGKVEPVTALLAAGAGVGANILLVVVFTLTDIIRYFPSYEGIAEILHSGSFLVRILTIAVTAPLLEEICFRGVTLNRMENMNKWHAILISSALFGVMHLNLLQGLYATVIGIMFGFIFVRFKSIWYPIIAHVAFNLVNVIMTEFEFEFYSIIILLAAIILFFGCGVLMLRRKYPPDVHGEEDQVIDNRLERL